MEKRIMPWGFAYYKGKVQIGAQIGFNGPDVASERELILAKRIERKINKHK